MGYISTTGFIMSDFFVRTYSLLISANTASNDASKVKNSPIVVYVHVSDYMDHTVATVKGAQSHVTRAFALRTFLDVSHVTHRSAHLWPACHTRILV
jgi:hypothetical protein